MRQAHADAGYPDLSDYAAVDEVSAIWDLIDDGLIDEDAFFGSDDLPPSPVLLALGCVEAGAAVSLIKWYSAYSVGVDTEDSAVSEAEAACLAELHGSVDWASPDGVDQVGLIGELIPCMPSMYWNAAMDGAEVPYPDLSTEEVLCVRDRIAALIGKFVGPDEFEETETFTLVELLGDPALLLALFCAPEPDFNGTGEGCIGRNSVVRRS